jgi:hypothetical protein
MSQSGAEVDLMDADVDFSINTNAAIISGGGLGTRPWVCETVSVNGDEFIHLDKQCKMLAKAMGISSKERWPWHGRDIVAYISDKRDEAVNKHVFEQLQSDDPLGDEVKTPEKGLSEFSVRRAGTLRQQALQKNEVPEIVNVPMPEFNSGDVQVEAFTALVLKPSVRGGKLFIRLDEEHLGWMKLLCASSDVLDAGVDEESRPDGFCVVDQPNVKWRKRNGAFHLCCRYKNESGAVKEHFVNPFAKNCVNLDVQHENVKEVAEQVQKFYDENHYR